MSRTQLLQPPPPQTPEKKKDPVLIEMAAVLGITIEDLAQQPWFVSVLT